MPWFGAKLLFRTFVKDTGEELTGEESVRLIKAKDMDYAEKKALEEGKKSEFEYEGQYGDTIQVKFEEVLDIYSISEDEIKHGTEIFSLMITPKEVKTLKKMYDVKTYPGQKKGGKVHANKDRPLKEWCQSIFADNKAVPLIEGVLDKRKKK